MFKVLEKIRSWGSAPGSLVVLGVGLLAGLITLASTGTFMVYANSEKFCATACHEMTYMAAEYKDTIHDKNRTGVRATCNDCHVPHDNPIRKYIFKAMDGTRHSFMFTFRMEPQVIRIHDAGASVVQENCIRCHTHQTQNVKEKFVTLNEVNHGGGKLCWDCHRETPHGRVNSLSSVPDARVPIPSSIIPEWLIKDVSKK